MSLLNGAVECVNWMPMVAQSAISALNVSSSVGEPLPQMMLKFNVYPLVMPAPHWFAPVPGFVQVWTPFFMVQPCELSNVFAAFRLKGYGLLTGPLIDEGVLGGSGLTVGRP